MNKQKILTKVIAGTMVGLMLLASASTLLFYLLAQ